MCVTVSMHACARVFYYTNSTLHRSPMCSTKALCGKTENQKTETPQSKKQKQKIQTASMPENLYLRPRKEKKVPQEQSEELHELKS